MRPITAIALSGGIDSLVSAALLNEQGHTLIGLHFLTGFETTESGKDDQSGLIHDQLTAMTNPLNIPIHVIDLHREFNDAVVDYFISTYNSGRTPNPCLVCNPLIKFNILYKKAQALGAQSIATGHYARIVSGADNRMHLYRGVDTRKDQSYFLARLTQSQLSHSILPLGGLTKDQTRRIAHKKGLIPTTPQESQDICFIKDGKYGDFLERQPGYSNTPGPIEDLNGIKIGRHSGLHRFTVGQRRGINCPAKTPYYVHHIDAKRNRLVVCEKNDLKRPSCCISDINWIAPCPSPGKAMEVKVRLRYRHQAVAATLTPLKNNSAEIQFKTPQEAVTPGQGAVFYQQDEVLGGGWIE